MYIDDIKTTKELCKLTRDELAEIEGAESLVIAMDTMAKLAINCDKTLPYLSKNYNWYIEPSIKLNILKQLFNNQCEKSINDILLKYYKGNFNIIFEELKKLFPNREHIFDEIIYAHINKKYYLSSITLMTQIDGVVYDLFKYKNFFHGDFFNSAIDKINKIEKPTIGTSFLKNLFNDKLPIKLSKSKRDKINFIHLNRHQVIHGEVIDFNTELNSLKAFSLLSSLALNLKYLKDTYFD
jgi:hypothetical protein